MSSYAYRGARPINEYDEIEFSNRDVVSRDDSDVIYGFRCVFAEDAT